MKKFFFSSSRQTGIGSPLSIYSTKMSAQFLSPVLLTFKNDDFIFKRTLTLSEPIYSHLTPRMNVFQQQKERFSRQKLLKEVQRERLIIFKLKKEAQSIKMNSCKFNIPGSNKSNKKLNDRFKIKNRRNEMFPANTLILSQLRLTRRQLFVDTRQTQFSLRNELNPLKVLLLHAHRTNKVLKVKLRHCKQTENVEKQQQLRIEHGIKQTQHNYTHKLEVAGRREFMNLHFKYFAMQNFVDGVQGW
ncbi:Hypothetical_protein [Hexamita inflata]|uniref:Hypothetical_protein n=1 Tax=Hexamita inflata TaxID=28002 RepID=A0AA86PWJ2_9EUKA|nr:Hypothetical protein HINF_LOCUS33087 [Hexamita inflata]